MSAPAIAVIPARGGSKRIPRKNVRLFRGVPLLARTIQMLKQADVCQRIVVSTDDDEVARIAVEAGGEVPFRRPAELASDTAATAPVIQHAISELEAAGSAATFICCVYPAAVLTRPSDIRTAYDEIRSTDADFVFSATSFPYPIQRALRRLPDGGCEMMHPEYRITRSQDLEPTFHDAGQFYWGRREAWLEQRPIFSPRSRLLLMPHDQVQDVDTEDDWRRAELIFDLASRDSTAR